jgi:thiol-disulfide isomerase/thioredoxin
MSAQNKSIKVGVWRGVLELTNQKSELVLPFNFEVSNDIGKTIITIFNAEEKIKVDEITVTQDSCFIKMPIFDSGFRLKILNDTLRGYFINYAKTEKNKIEFEAIYGETNRFKISRKALHDFSGKYEVTFNPNQSDEYKAIGLFKQTQEGIVTGTFLTETGDYRYLEGVAQGNNMALSCFDGSHAFLFFANSLNQKQKTDTLSGKVFYGISGNENWVAYKNDTFELKDPERITTLKNKEDKVYFSFKNLSNKTVSLSDDKFINKIIIIQLMGSWCPNCMDETKYLSTLYKKYQSKGLEIIALAYERTPDFEKAKSNVLRLKNRFDVDYEILITGLTGKAKASESMPFLSSVSAFPTTLILDRKHQVVSIYTGFNGPATGKAYEQYTKKTENLIEQLLLKK